MSRIHELRIFMDANEMMADFYRFEQTQADTGCYTTLSAKSGKTEIRWGVVSECEPMTSRFAGINFNRIKMDVRSGHRAMMYMMTRLRSPDGVVEPMQVFYKRPWNEQ